MACLLSNPFKMELKNLSLYLSYTARIQTYRIHPKAPGLSPTISEF